MTANIMYDVEPSTIARCYSVLNNTQVINLEHEYGSLSLFIYSKDSALKLQDVINRIVAYYIDQEKKQIEVMGK